MSKSVSVQKCLKKATSRAKSDVANKLVSMFLHEVSRKLSSEFNVRVSDDAYSKQVEDVFGAHCAFCGLELEQDRLAVEHLEGMNRIRLGLHIPGNVVLACKECNKEKRRDDQLKSLILSQTGWGSFLSHDGTRCTSGCESCAYWSKRWPDPTTRRQMLLQAQTRIIAFQSGFDQLLSKALSLREIIGRDVESLYRECKDFAQQRIAKLSAELFVR